MLWGALILLLLGVPMQFAYCAKLFFRPQGRNRPWFVAAIAGGVCNIVAGLLLRDPLLATGQAAVLGVYFFTRPKSI